MAQAKWKESFQWATGAPKWAWWFMGPCIAIPIVSLGGAIPAFLGFVGAYACGATAKQPWNIWVRVILCLAVTLTCWLGFLVLAAVLQSRQAQSQ